MAQTDITQPTGRQKPGVRKMTKSALRIDMTPMVDLGFLLISFFVIVSELQQPTSMPVIMPKDSDGPPNEVGDSYALTVLLNGNKNYYYMGSFENAVTKRQIINTNLATLRQVILQKQSQLDDTLKFKEGRKGLMLLVKPTEEASYKSVVDVLDECTITGVKKYALVNPENDEIKWLADKE